MVYERLFTRAKPNKKFENYFVFSSSWESPFAFCLKAAYKEKNFSLLLCTKKPKTAFWGSCFGVRQLESLAAFEIAFTSNKLPKNTWRVKFFRFWFFGGPKILMEPFLVTFRGKNGKNRIKIHFWLQLLN